MRILLTGRNGQVGSALEQSLAPLGEVAAFDRHGFDLLDLNSIRTRIKKEKPQVIVNAAAYTAVDRAEREEDVAFAVNARAVEELAREAKALDALLVHFSTDYVFDGEKSAPYVETDAPNPLSVYGHSKLAGERAIAASGCRHFIFRTSWVYAPAGRNFVHAILAAAKTKPELRVVNDQRGAPTSSLAIAGAVAQALAHPGKAGGLYHLSAGGETSWHGFAREILSLKGLQTPVAPISSGEYRLRRNGRRIRCWTIRSWARPSASRCPTGGRAWRRCSPQSTNIRSMDFIDLKTQYAALRDAINARIQRVLDHGQYVMGPEVKELEDRLAARTGAKHCVAVASGTEALLIALLALGVKPGDEVVTTPFTFAATAEMIALIGAKPVFVDVEEDTANIDVSKLEAAITPRTRAIMPVSLYGQPADMDEINAIAARRALPVIEDAAQSFGATYKGRQSGNLSAIGCTSFFPSKPLGCYGDGGPFSPATMRSPPRCAKSAYTGSRAATSTRASASAAAWIPSSARWYWRNSSASTGRSGSGLPSARTMMRCFLLPAWKK